MTRPARIESLEVLRDLRAKFVKFDGAARQALAACDGDVQSTQAWLANEQRLNLRRELRRREEELVTAQREYAQARWSASDLSRSTGDEQKRELDRAKRRKEEVETRIVALERWSVLLEQEVAKLRRPCLALSNLLDELTPKALARLDRMMDALEDYLRAPPSPEGSP